MINNDLHSVLRRLGHAPKRSLGQNFLVDKNFASFAVQALNLQGGEWVVEIGPGLGALTEFLLQSPAGEVLLLEKDRCLAAFLREQITDPRVQVQECDALDFDLRHLCREREVCLIGNLPYNISTPLLTLFSSPISPVRRMVLTVQKEVALRITAQADGKEYGAYTVLLQRFWSAKFLKKLPAEAFFPAPTVESAVVYLERRPAAEVVRCDADALERIVRKGFHQRRKKLRKLLGCEETEWAELAARIQFSIDARAEDLNPIQWQMLAAALSPEVEDYTPVGSDEIFDVVDEADEVVTSLPRSEVHARYLRHRAVHILIWNAAGEIYLQRRAPWKDINPDVWDSSAAGHLAAGEDYQTGAHRELLEEIGVDTELAYLGKLPPSKATGNEFIEVYEGKHEGPFRLAGLEITGGAFFPLAQIRTWAAARPQDFSPVFLLCLPLIGEVSHGAPETRRGRG